MSRFNDRREAGRLLAARFAQYATRSDVIVLGLPRGGVPVAYEIARALEAPLDVFTVRKIGHPLNDELAVGAIASGGVQVFDHDAMNTLGLTPAMLKPIVEREMRELQRREQLYRDDRPFPDLTGKVVVLVDDGIATGASANSAVEALRKHHPARIIVAAPVGSREACKMLETIADACVCVDKPEPFYGVGIWYYDFEQTTDAEVLELLQRANGLPLTA